MATFNREFVDQRLREHHRQRDLDFAAKLRELREDADALYGKCKHFTCTERIAVLLLRVHALERQYWSSEERDESQSKAAAV